MTVCTPCKPRCLDNGTNYSPYHHIVVFFNATNAQVTFTNAALAGLQLHLHPVRQHSSDPTVIQSTFNAKEGTATIPALTTAVFVSDTR
jgi:pullulanase